MKKALMFFSTYAAAAACADVWVGCDGGLARYDEAGAFVARYDDYRRPVALVLDDTRGRLWFIDAYDYKLVYFDVRAGAELLAVAGAAHAADVSTTDLKTYLAVRRPVEPSLALDASDGGVWLADFYGHQLAKYDAQGREIVRTSAVHEPFAVAPAGGGAWVAGGPRTLHLVDGAGEIKLSQTGVNEARGLAYDAAGNLLVVADYRNNRVLGVDAEGRLKKKVTGVELPFAVVVATAGTVWVATDFAGVQKTSLDREEITAVITDQEGPHALSIDACGRLWVAYEEAGEVRAYDADGKWLLTIPRLKSPAGIAAE